MGFIYTLFELKTYFNRRKRIPADINKINFKYPKLSIQLLAHLAFTLLFLFFIILLLLRFVTGTVGTTQNTTDLDIFFVLDTSLSMNTEDMRGKSRIDYAKEQLIELSSSLDNHRIGLITYNHIASVESPLSTDKGMLSTAIETTSTIDYLYANGSFAEIGLEKALERLFPKDDALSDRGKLVILLSDGSDSNSSRSEIRSTLNKFEDKNIPVYTIGVGTTTGGTIPWFLDDEKKTVTSPANDRPVISKLDEESLVNIAQRTNGQYLHIENIKQLETEIKSTQYNVVPNPNSQGTAYEETYHFFSIISLILLMLVLLELNDFKIKLRKKPKK